MCNNIQAPAHYLRLHKLVKMCRYKCNVCFEGYVRWRHLVPIWAWVNLAAGHSTDVFFIKSTHRQSRSGLHQFATCSISCSSLGGWNITFAPDCDRSAFNIVKVFSPEDSRGSLFNALFEIIWSAFNMATPFLRHLQSQLEQETEFQRKKLLHLREGGWPGRERRGRG